MRRRRYTILIPDAESGHALVVARCLSKAGAKIIALGNATNCALRYSRRKRQFWAIPRAELESPTEFLCYLSDRVRSGRVDVYLPVDEPAHRFAIENRAELSQFVRLPPLATLDSFDRAIHKDLLADFLRKSSIASPYTCRLPSPTGQDSVPDGLRYPFVAKPAYGSGGTGIVLINGPDEWAAFKARSPEETFGSYILQQYVRGFDIDCSAICLNGKILAHTIQRGIVARDRSFAASAGVVFGNEDGLLSLVRQMFAGLSFSGIAHVDARYDSDTNEFKIIEINARYWGSLTASLKAGINFPKLACDLAMGEDIGAPSYRSVRYIDSVALAKRILASPFDRKSYEFRLGETDLEFMLTDPVAEFANVLIRHYNQARACPQ